MELIVISDNAVKIMLDRSDIASFGGELSKSKVGACTVIRILKNARADSFADGSQRFRAEFYPSKDGGGELFISKLGSEKPGIYIFDDFFDLSDAVKAMKLSRKKQRRDLFSAEGKFFLVLSPENAETDGLLSEYGRKASKGCELFLEEHGKRIADPFE